MDWEMTGVDSDAEEESMAPQAVASTQSPVDLTALRVECRLDQSPIVCTGSDQTRKMLVQVIEDRLDEEKLSPAPLDLVCVIDCSGSMAGFKLQQVQQTLLYLLDMLQPTDRLGIVAFNSEAVILNSLRLATKENKCGRLLSNVQALSAVGGTNIVAGLRKAVQILKQRKTKNSLASIFLLSDGNDNFDLHGLDKLLQSCANIDGLSLHTFGYGEDHDPEALRKIAQSRRGNFYYVKDLARVDEAFVDCLALLTSAIGTAATLSVKLLPSPVFKELSFQTCYGPQWSGDSDTGRTIELGQVYAGMRKGFVAEITLDASKKIPADIDQTIPLAQVELKVRPLGKDAQEISVKADLAVRVVGQNVTVEIVRNQDVETNYLRVTGALILDTAKDLLRKGDLGDVQKIFEGFRAKMDKLKVDDVVLKNLAKHIDYGYQHGQQLTGGYSSSQVRDRDKKELGHYLQQQTYALYNEQSAPEWTSGLYQNSRQTRYMGEYMAKKCK